MAITVEELAGEGLISRDLFNRLVDRIAGEHNFSLAYAKRIMDQALAYLAACADSPEPLAPSQTVDIGWHTFILYTRDYAEFCEKVAGQFIHHVPNDGKHVANDPKGVTDKTIDALRREGYAVDLPLWKAFADCNQCSNGCTHSNGDTGCHHHPVRTATVPA
jgi:hypothetical protein